MSHRLRGPGDHGNGEAQDSRAWYSLTSLSKVVSRPVEDESGLVSLS